MLCSSHLSTPGILRQPRRPSVLLTPSPPRASTPNANPAKRPTNQQRKPWAEVFDRSSFSKPATLQEVRQRRERARQQSVFVLAPLSPPPPAPASPWLLFSHSSDPAYSTTKHHQHKTIKQQATSRLRKNVAYFRVNYAAATVATVALAFLSHPSSLLVLGALVLAWVYVFALHTGPLVINGRTLSDREKFFGMSAASFVLVFFLTGVGSLAFSALVAAGALVAAHGAMRAPDDLFLDEGGDPGAQGGLLAILMGGGGGGSGGAGNV